MDTVICVAEVISDGHEVEDKLIIDAILELADSMTEKGKIDLVKRINHLYDPSNKK